MTQIVPKEDKVKEFRDFLDNPTVQRQLSLARRSSINPETLARMIMTTVQQDDKLLACTPASVLGAAITATQLGLEVGSACGHAYLVAYGKTCTLIVGWRGYIQLAHRSGQVQKFSAHNVYSNERYSIDYGRAEEIQHVPLPPGERGEYVATYAIVRLKDGGAIYEWMWKADVDAIQARSASKTGPWKTDTDEMRRKTAVRRAFKYCPSSAEMQRAVGLDDQAAAGVPQSLDFVDVPSAASEPASPPTSLADHVEQERAKAEPDKPAPKLEPEPAPGEVSQDLAAHRRDLAERIAALNHESREYVFRNAGGIKSVADVLKCTQVNIMAGMKKRVEECETKPVVADTGPT